MKHLILISLFMLFPRGYADDIDDILSEALFVESQLYTADRIQLDQLNEQVAESINTAKAYKAFNSPLANETNRQRLTRSLGVLGFHLYQKKYKKERKQQKRIHAENIVSALTDRGNFFQLLANLHKDETKTKLLEKALKDYSAALEYLPDKPNNPQILHLLFIRSQVLNQLGRHNEITKDWQQITDHKTLTVKGLLTTNDNPCPNSFNPKNKL